MNQSFWKDKRVFITGHTGFKGSWLSLWLQLMQAQVTGYALAAPTSPSLFEEASVGQSMKSVIADILDFSMLQKSMEICQPEIVFHLAAQSLVRPSYINPVETYATNVMGTVHLLEAVRHVPSVKAVVIITSDKCYENREWVWGYREDEPLGGYDPYSNSKGCAELVSLAYRSSFFNAQSYAQHGVGLATARAGNVIGGGDWAKDRLIPDILSSITSGKTIMLRNPKAIRPWQHVMEPLRGYLVLAEHLYTEGPVFAEAWNFGPHDKDVRSVEWILNKTIQLWGKPIEWQVETKIQPHEANYLKLDISKASIQLNWHPVLSLIDSLALIIDWWKGYQAGGNSRELIHKQIYDYLEIVEKSI